MLQWIVIIRKIPLILLYGHLCLASLLSITASKWPCGHLLEGGAALMVCGGKLWCRAWYVLDCNQKFAQTRRREKESWELLWVAAHCPESIKILTFNWAWVTYSMSAAWRPGILNLVDTSSTVAHLRLGSRPSWNVTWELVKVRRGEGVFSALLWSRWEASSK